MADSLELYITREIFNRDIGFLFTDDYNCVLITTKITRLDDRYTKIYVRDFVHLLRCSTAINS